MNFWSTSSTALWHSGRLFNGIPGQKITLDLGYPLHVYFVMLLQKHSLCSPNTPRVSVLNILPFHVERPPAKRTRRWKSVTKEFEKREKRKHEKHRTKRNLLVAKKKWACRDYESRYTCTIFVVFILSRRSSLCILSIDPERRKSAYYTHEPEAMYTESAFRRSKRSRWMRSCRFRFEE